jgi:tRNA A37 threonylcarbamoyladenosine modification protein TsaB
LIILIDDLLNKNKLLIKDLNRIYVNRGPGSFAGIRSSISIAKGYHISQNIDYYCFSFLDFINLKSSIKNQIFKNTTLLSQYHNIKYEKIPELCNKYKIKKNLIKPLYLS